MNGIVININPVIINLGALELRWYGLAITIAVTAAILITARQMKKIGVEPRGHLVSVARSK
jgi:prolipoprotein diacylglyceryltransferase